MVTLSALRQTTILARLFKPLADPVMVGATLDITLARLLLRHRRRQSLARHPELVRRVNLLLLAEGVRWDVMPLRLQAGEPGCDSCVSSLHSFYAIFLSFFLSFCALAFSRLCWEEYISPVSRLPSFRYYTYSCTRRLQHFGQVIMAPRNHSHPAHPYNYVHLFLSHISFELSIHQLYTCSRGACGMPTDDTFALIMACANVYFMWRHNK